MEQTPDPTIKKPKFTPGPWFLDDGIEGMWQIQSERGGWSICETAGGCGANNLPGEDESDANARLIAAAPALYEALTVLLKTETNLGGVSGIQLLDAVDQARAALSLVDHPTTEEGQS